MGESDDLRAFIRDLMARFDRGMDATMRQLEATSRQQLEATSRQHEATSRQHDATMRQLEIRDRQSERYFKAVRAHQEADRDRLDDILAENRAQRAALLSILDRLDNGGPAAEPG
jgi:hypothetical protein